MTLNEKKALVYDKSKDLKNLEDKAKHIMVEIEELNKEIDNWKEDEK